MKFEKEVNIYADNAIAKRFKASETSLEIVQGKIEALISESELIELQNGGKTMYSQLASAILTLDALSLNFSDLTTKYDGLSEQYTELDSKVAEYKLGVDGLSATIASVQETLEEDYSTTLQMNAAIKASVDELSSTISRNYVTNNKLSGYSTTEQMQSAIDQKANEISTSVSQTYATKTALDDAKLDAISSANTNTAELLKNYSTTAQMNSAINQKADQITTSVSKTYATKTSVSDAKDEAIASANQNTSNLLKNYSTTTEMNSAINQKADEITTTVSETYMTQAEFDGTTFGARNLIRNSTGLLGTLNWTSQFIRVSLTTKQNETLLRKNGDVLLFKKNRKSSLATIAAVQSAGYPTYQQTAFQLGNTTIGEKYAYSARFLLKPSTTYTMSGYVYVASGAKGIDIFVLASNSNTDLDSNFTDYDTAHSILSHTSTNKWYYFQKSFTTGASVKSGIVRVDHNGVSSTGNTAKVYFGNLKLEESNNKVTDWTPAPEDDADYTNNRLKDYSTTVQMNSAITQKANEITTMVSQTYVTTAKYNDLENTVDTQYTTISSKYTQLADKFTWVVSGGTSSSNFTITSRLAELVANDINLHGRVTFSGLDSSAQGKINTAQSTANSAQSTANSVQSTVNSNKSKWDGAASWTSSNGSNMTNLRNMILKWTDNAVSTTTQINGGWIKTNTITADKIALGDFTNYATDGSFELGVYSDSGYFSIVTSQKLTGTKSLKMSAGVSGFKTFDLNKYKNFAVYSGEKIYVSWWGRRENANQPAGINIQIVDQNGNNLHYDISGTTQMPETAANNTWIRYSYVATVQSTGYALVQFKKRADGTLSGNWYVDEVVVRRMTSGELIVSGSITADKLSVTSLESISARIGGWTISGNNLMDDKTNFMVRIAAPTEYGGDGNGNADVLVVRDKTNDTYPLVISSNGQVLATRCKFEGGTIGGWTITETDIYNDNGASSAGIGKSGTTYAFWAGATYANRNDAYIKIGHAGEFYLKDYLTYLPNGMSYDPKVKMTMGGWQIKTGTNAWGYDHFEYWDTIETQENGICSHGPWVVWGGWNGGPSVNVENYKFVVTDQGVCKAMSWVTGSRAEWKENIVPYHKSALQEIMNSDVYYYNLKDKGRGAWQEGRHIGFVIGDQYNVSSDILDGSGGSIDMYSALAIAYKAIQEQQQEIEMLKNKLQQS